MAQDQLEAPEGTEQAPIDTGPDEAEKGPDTLFKFSTWLHVGAGAESCEEGETGDCADPHHFHGWCRLPNQFQHREIREKALAAKARRIRQLRDPEADGNAVLEGELDAIAAAGEQGKRDLVESFVQQSWLDFFNDVEAEMKEFTDDNDERPYEYIERDRKRYQELRVKEPEDRPTDEYEELERHMDRFTEAFEPKFQERLKALREELMAIEIGELINRTRDERIGADSTEAFNHVYATWEWYVGTLRAPGGERYWKSVEHLQEAPPEVVGDLKETFDDLERTRNDAEKNS